MTPIELAHACAQALASPDMGKNGVILTVPKGCLPKGFPRGTLLCESKRDGVVVRTSSYDPLKVLKFLQRTGAVSVTTDGTTMTISA